MDLYRKYEVYSPIHHGGLTNHLPMLITALEILQVNESDMVNILEKYIDQSGVYELTDATFPITEFEQEYINKTNYYQSQINHKGVDIIVGMFLNEHSKNTSSGLFHGLIRLSYALKSKNELYISQALSYFDLISEESLVVGKEVDANTLTNHLQTALEHRVSLSYEFKSIGTTNKFKEIYGFEGIKDNIVYPKNIEFNLELLLDLFLDTFLKSDDFYILHIITGFEALLSVEEYFTDFKSVLIQFYLDAQIMMMLNDSFTDCEESHNKFSFDKLLNRVTELQDAHDIKLFHSLYILNQRFMNEKLLKIANRIFDK